MATGLTELRGEEPIVDPLGRASPYFLRYLFDRGGFLTSQEQALATLQTTIAGKVDKTRKISTPAGSGLSGGGDLSADRTLSLSAGIDLLTDVDTSTTPPTDGQALVWKAASSLWLPGSVAGGGGGGGSLTLIGTTTLAAAAATLTVSGIPASYNDLILVFNGQGTGASPVVYMQANGDTGTNYNDEVWNRFGQAQNYNTATPRVSSMEGSTIATGVTNSPFEGEIIGYSSGFTKRGIFRHPFADNTNAFSEQSLWTWKNAAAINSITLLLSTGNFTAGSTLSIYGRGGTGGTAAAVGAGIKGMTVIRKTADQTIAANTWVTLTWDSKEYDNLNAFTAGGSVWTVPAGCYFMRVNARLTVNNPAAGNKFVNISRVSGTGSSYVAGDLAYRQNESMVSVQSQWIAVVPGDTYNIQYNSATATAMAGTDSTFGGHSRVQIEWATTLTDLIGSGSSGGSNQLLSAQTLAAAAASVTLTVPSGYTDLRLRINARGTISLLTDDMNIAFNGDTTLANYQMQQGQANSSSVSAAASPGGMTRHIGSVMAGTATAGESGMVDLIIPNYAGTTFRKVYTGANGLAAYPLVKQISGRWANTAAITSIVITLNSGNTFVAGSDFRLYGIA